MRLKSIAVYCGSREGNNVLFAEAARELGKELVARDIRLIYGGGAAGLMGIIADEVLDRSGDVVGIIPKLLVEKELAHHKLPNLKVAHNMHERKHMMAELSDGFIAMPGGIGTMDEFFEVLTWLQIGYHRKPVGLLNVNGYYDKLLEFIDVIVENDFMKKSGREMIIVSDKVPELIDKMEKFELEFSK